MLNNTLNQLRPTGFMAYQSASTTDDKTGDGSAYVVICDTPIKTDGNYNTGTGVYTVGSTGFYYIAGTVRLNNIDATHTLYTLKLVTTTYTYDFFKINAFAASESGIFAMCAGVTVPLTAGDTFAMHAVVSNGTKTVGIIGSGSPYSTFISCVKIQ